MAMAMLVSSVHSPGSQPKPPPPTMATSSSGPRGGPNSYAAPRASPAAVPSRTPQARSSCAVVKVMGRVSFHPPTCGLVVMGLRGFDEYLPQPWVADRLGYRCPRRGQAASLLPPWGASSLVVAPAGGYAASSARYRYRAAWLTPRYLAMSAR